MNIMEYSLLAFGLIVAGSFFRGSKDRFEDFCVGAAIPSFIVLLLPIGAATGWLRPATIDGSLRSIDLAFGLDGFAMTRWLVAHGWWKAVAITYKSLPLMMACAWVLERPRRLLRAAVIGPLLAVPFYLLFPAAGPAYAFPNFPLAGAHAAPVELIHPRNCVPSMHFAWALLLALNLSDRRWRWIFIVYAALMAFATVAGGEHYFIDVIVAVPFTFAVQWIAGRRFSRKGAFTARGALGEKLVPPALKDDPKPA